MSKKRLRPVPAKKSAPYLAPTPAPNPAPNPAPTAANAIAALETALAAAKELAAQRLEAKQSISRLLGVARELRELIKVMSVYGV